MSTRLCAGAAGSKNRQRRALERPLQQLEALRDERGLPVDGELFGDELDNVRELGA